MLSEKSPNGLLFFMKKIFSFGAVGVVGFFIDSCIFFIANHFLPYWLSRLISFIFAVLTTWILNRNITFKIKNDKVNLFREFMKYLSSMIIGGTINYLSFIILLKNIDLFRSNPLYGIALGSILGMLANYFFASFWVYKKSKK